MARLDQNNVLVHLPALSVLWGKNEADLQTENMSRKEVRTWVEHCHQNGNQRSMRSQTLGIQEEDRKRMNKIYNRGRKKSEKKDTLDMTRKGGMMYEFCRSTKRDTISFIPSTSLHPGELRWRWRRGNKEVFWTMTSMS